MAFRYRKRSGFLGGLLHFNWSKRGLSSISVGPRGATINIPVAREGNTRTTVGLPGTGLSWSEESKGQRSVQSDLPDNEIHTGPRGGHWQWRQSRDGDFYKDYLSDNEFRSVAQRRQSQRSVPQTTSTEQIIQDVMATIAGPEQVGDALWRQGLVQQVIDFDDTPRKVREAALLIKSPEMVELHMRRARGQASTVRAGREALQAATTVIEWAEDQGWTSSVE